MGTLANEKEIFFTDSCVSQWNGEGARRVSLQAAGPVVPAGRSAEVMGFGGPGVPPAPGVGRAARRPLRPWAPDRKPLHRASPRRSDPEGPARGAEGGGGGQETGAEERGQGETPAR